MHTRLAQHPLSYFENMPDTFVPTEEDRKRGNWAVVFENLDECGEPDIESNCHTIPIRGVHHLISVTCWCSPSIEKLENGKYLFNHHMSQ